MSSARWDDLGQPETLEALHKALLLPENYEIMSVARLPGHPEILMLVESDAIPVGDAHISQTQVTPYYHKHDDGKVELTRIEINQWDGQQWLKVR